MIHIVTSKDGVQLVTESDERTVPFDQALAARSTAAELVAQGDFTRLHDGEEIFYEVAGPAERRAAFRLIQGGRRD